MATEPPPSRWTRCRGALWLALLFDALGALGLLAGACLDSDVSDLLIYLGGVGVFFSLPWWVFWSVGNVEVPPDELRDDVGLGGRGESVESWRARRLARLARSFNAHFSGSSCSSCSHADRPRPRAHFFTSSSSSSTSSTSARPGGAEGQPAWAGRRDLLAVPSQAGVEEGPKAAPPPTVAFQTAQPPCGVSLETVIPESVGRKSKY